MKRQKFIRRDVKGKALEDTWGWSAEIYGFPVVLCRAYPRSHRWICCDPQTGLKISSRMEKDRERLLTVTSETVERAAVIRGCSPEEWLHDLVETCLFLRRELKGGD